MSAYIDQLKANAKEDQDKKAEKQRADVLAARERLTPLEGRLARLLATIPPEVQREGLSLPVLQASLRGRWRGSCHPGELGTALRTLGFRRVRRWRREGSYCALWLLASAPSAPEPSVDK